MSKVQVEWTADSVSIAIYSPTLLEVLDLPRDSKNGELAELRLIH